MKKLNIPFLILFVAFLSCTKKSNSIEVIQPHVELKISEVFEGLVLTPILFNAQSGFGFVDKIEIYKDKVYVLDTEFSKSLQVFSMQGEFLKKIQSFESQNIYDFVIDSDADELIFYTQGKRIEKFTSDGSYLKTVRLNIIIEKLLGIHGDNLLCYLGYEPISDSEKYNLVVLDKNTLAVKNKLLPFQEEPLLSLGLTNQFATFEERNLFCLPFDNNLYSIGPDDVEVLHTLDFENQFLTPEKLNVFEDEYEDKVTNMDGLAIIDNKIIFNYKNSGRPEYRLINEGNKEVFKLKEGKSFEEFLISFALLHYYVVRNDEFISVIDLDHFRALISHFEEEIDAEILGAFDSEAFFAIVKFKLKKTL
ncbi:MAG: 6-bladed beta-propeller [Mongoliitalea sp.]